MIKKNENMFEWNETIQKMVNDDIGKDNSCQCHCHDGNEPVWWQNENYNAFIDSNGEMEVTINGYTKCFHVDCCPKCGKKF